MKKKPQQNSLKAYLKESTIEAGCDEAGRGSLAGPLFAAAVILPLNFSHPLLNDSKKLSKKSRELLRGVIEREALAWGVASISAQEIDEINILNASIVAMHRALDILAITPEHIVVDGNQFREYNSIPHTCVVKGDAIYSSVAAASILAKTHRDNYMEKLSKEYPGYGWEKSMAYPTKAHKEAIERLGVTAEHRLSFNLGENFSKPKQHSKNKS